MKSKFKKYMPHAIAVVLFIGLSIAFMAPIVFENKNLYQSDVISSGSWGKDLKDYHRQTGDYAFWSNSMFSGMPANYTFAPPTYNIFEYFHKMIHSVFNGNVFLIFICLIGFYVFLISLRCNPWLSIIGSIAYTFATFNIVSIDAGHINKVLVMATMAPVIGGVILTYRKKYLWGSIVTLVFTGFNVYWSHQQISFYLLIIILILAIVYLFYALRENTLKDFFKSSVLLIVVALLAIAPDFGTLISKADYMKDTMRGGAVLQSNAEGQKESSGLDINYAFGWSYGRGETMTMLIPDFYGSSSKPFNDKSEFYKTIVSKSRAGQISNEEANYLFRYTRQYWGDQPNTGGPVYMGAIVCFLFILGLIIVKKPEKWWMMIATIVAVIMSWGKNSPLINDFLFYHLPLYNKFRTPSMALTIAEVTMAALAVLALKEIFDNKEDRKIYLKPVYISTCITGGLCLIFALMGGSLMSFTGMNDTQIAYPPDMLAAIISDRKSMLVSDSWRSFFFIALASGALWFYINKKVKIVYLTAFIGILIFVDLWTVDKRFINYDSFVPKQKTTEIIPTDVDRQILSDPDPHYRVLNLAYGIGNALNESTTSNFHKSIGGYSPAKLRRYQDIIDYYFARGLNINILNMLNTKWVIQPDQQSGQQVARINPGALGNAWFVNELVWVDSPDEEIVALKDFNPLQTAFIDKEWQSSLTGWEALQHETADSTAFIRLTNYANPGNLFYESYSSKPQLAVFSEVYYKTWKAYIDGVEAPLVRVNYILRGLQTPAGNHKIELKCIDEVYLRGAIISKIASILVGIILLSLFGLACFPGLLRSSR